MHAPVLNKAMSQRPTREERRLAARNLPVASKCLAIVLLPQKKQTTKNSEDVNSGDRDRKCSAHVGSTATADNSKATSSIGGNSAGAPYNGKTLLEDFKQQNRTCYWNPALIESIRQLEYLGFVEPCTVLVGGMEIHLENLRSAWGRRVLKPPNNFTIDRIGDVNGIEMQVIPQTQFIPLPDSLCLIITELNNAQQAATLDSIRARLQRWYQNTTLPSHQLIYDTLGQLIRERKVFHNGSGYCVVTPETYHLPTSDPSLTCTASWLPYHPMYIPVFPQQQHVFPQQQHTFRAPTRSISCQVTQIEEKQSSEGSVKQQKNKPRPRSASVRACRGKDKAGALVEKENAEIKRSMSVKYKAEKAKAMTKDLNLKMSNINQDRDKGEKVSLFTKIFGRKKKKLAATGATTTASTSSGGGNQGSEVEYATFSAQFPPPEWVWYQQQLERHRRTQEWVSKQTVKSGTWHHFSSTGAEASSGGVDSGNHDMAFTEFSHPTTDHYASGKSHVYATLGHMQGIAEGREVYGAGGQEKREEEENRLKQSNRLSGSHAKKSHGHGHHHRDHHKHKEHRKTVHENNYDVPMTQPQVLSHMAVGANMDMTPLTIEPDCVYTTPGPISERFMPWHSTPCYDVPPSQLDSHMPNNIVYSSTQEQSEAVKSHHHHRRSHRSKRHGRKQYTYYESGNDITIEYKGRMPKKNSSVAQSRDSGVNCIAGLPRNRQVYMNQPDLNMTQEMSYQPTASADQPTLTATATASSLQPHTMSTQRGTPYTSMEQRSPEGSSGDHAIIINDISTDIAHSGTNDAVNGRGTPLAVLSVVGARVGKGDSEGVERGLPCMDDRSEVGLPCMDDRSEGGLPCMDDRSECEGVSQDQTPHFVAMSYCDSSVGEEGAGGGEVILCQAEINHFQIPQLVLDTEPPAIRNNLGAEPDVALSSAGSKDTLDRTADESERSVETVIRSPQAGGANSSKISSKSAQSTDMVQHLAVSSRSAEMAQFTAASSNGDGDVTGEDENPAVSALGNELQEMGVVDSGFSSPRNTDDKENQQQLDLASNDGGRLDQPAATTAHQRNGGQQARNHHHHNEHEAAEDYTVPEHKSKHERIKAFVKQSNQLLEQRQYTSHPHNIGNVGRYSPVDVDSYPTCHPHHYPPHQHYAPVPKPLHPIQHHHQPPPAHHHHQQQQQQQQQMLNNQRYHYHGRPQSTHGAVRERPRSQTVWPGGDKVAPSDLQAFQQQQLSNKKLGLNGEFEVMGVV